MCVCAYVLCACIYECPECTYANIIRSLFIQTINVFDISRQFIIAGIKFVTQFTFCSATIFASDNKNFLEPRVCFNKVIFIIMSLFDERIVWREIGTWATSIECTKSHLTQIVFFVNVFFYYSDDQLHLHRANVTKGSMLETGNSMARHILNATIQNCYKQTGNNKTTKYSLKSVIWSVFILHFSFRTIYLNILNHHITEIITIFEIIFNAIFLGRVKIKNFCHV